MNLLPKDEKFFDLLLDQASLINDASGLLAGGLESTASGDVRGMAQKIRELERQGDQVVRKIYRLLHKTFITPIDPEDIHHLATLIDDILDHLEAVAYRFDAYDLQQSSSVMAEIARMVQGCIKASIAALEVLKSEGLKKPDELTKCCEEINRQELATEDRVREVVRALFESEQDPIELIKKKEVYSLLESTADCCENLADVLESIAVKNS